ncbi:MAG: SCP2 sterol-binding domain-containing protein [Chloroflexi bacterium]|nr:SCP2 sterol-binding domain-containing protein [Chloroflexota bacterium]
MASFPTAEWLQALMDKLNGDASYGRIAHAWEWDMLCVVEADGKLKNGLAYYLDLWHGKCRRVEVLAPGAEMKAAFILKAPYENYVRLLRGQLDPMQAMMTRKLAVQGNMAVMLRNVPTVLDFVRCCKEVTDKILF